MFVIGMELIKVLKNKASEAVVISHASIVIPRWYWFSYFVFNRFAPEGFSFSLVCLWNCHEHNLPVLARIVQERKFIKRLAL
jgi:Kef-type K+ transport system membrane component KefB